MTDKTEEEKRLDHLRMMAGQNMDAESDKLTSATPGADEIILDQMEELPVGRDFMWLHPIELIKSLFSSRKD
jgi:hypothetical protein